MKICIDAGHSKLTPGKRSFDSLFFEYEFNYDVARRIKKQLDRHGQEVWVQYVENANPASELRKRIKDINSKKPDLVVSIHANAYGSDWNTANGWEIYCNDPKDDLAEGTKLAKAIHSQSIKMLELRDRGIKDAHGVASIVTKTLMPAVLIEHGFYTNKEELKKLQSNKFREKCSIADAKGILEYLKIEWKEEAIEMKTVKKIHWAEKHLDSLVKKGLINSPELHRESLDEPISKGQIFALLDRITEGK